MLWLRAGEEGSPCRCRTLPRSPSPEKKLLAGVYVGSSEAGVRACLLESTGEHRTIDNIRLLDLVRQVWPDRIGRPETLCRSLRYLVDSTKHDMMLRATPHGIYVRLDFVRALVAKERVLFLGTDHPTFGSFFSELSEQILDRRCLEDRTFDRWVMECILCSCVTLHKLRLHVLKPVVEDILHSIVLDRSEDSILQLYPVNVALSGFIEHVRPLVTCLMNGAKIEFERRRSRSHWHRPPDSFLSRQCSAVPGDGADSEGSASGSSLSTTSCNPRHHQSVLEDALDNWSHDAEEMLAEAGELSMNVEDAIRFLEASMSCTRNRLLQFELCTEVAALSCSMGAMISGIFGMNLQSGVELEPGWFHGTVVVIVFMAGTIALVAAAIVYRSKRHYSVHGARFGNNKFFRSFGDDRYILGLAGRESGSSGVTVPESSVGRVLKDLKEPALPLPDGNSGSPFTRRWNRRCSASSNPSPGLGSLGTFRSYEEAPVSPSPLLGFRASSPPRRNAL